MKMNQVKVLYMDSLPYLQPIRNNNKKALIRWIEFNVEFMESGHFKRKYSGNSAYQKLVTVIRAAKKEKDKDIIREAMKVAGTVIQKMLSDNFQIFTNLIHEKDFATFAKEQPDVFAQHILVLDLSK